jgi:nicotinate-nucleotide pyrophosphorylase (carboxylating)
MPHLDPPIGAIRDAVARALAEDLTPLGDLTSALLPDGAHARADFVARMAGVIAGTACAAEAFAQLDSRVVVTWAVGDGDRVEAGQVLGTVEGPAPAVLTGERTALNVLGHLSGVATAAAAYVDAVASVGGSARVWDTRKTTPGLRTLEKAAVRAGGGVNHRGNLSDWLMFKDNHLTLLGITEAVRRAKATWPARTVHVECERLEQVREAIDAGADAILLDNMEPEEVEACVHVAADAPRPVLLEASGGITLETVRRFATTGVDLISVGAITNSARVLDIGLDVAVTDASRSGSRSGSEPRR